MSSDADLDEAITVSREGITVEKEFTADQFPVPTIRFELSSTLDESVEVVLSEDIPEEFPMDAVGFHPDYEAEHWTGYEDHHVEFTRNLDPGESVTTLYGLQIEDQDDAHKFMGEPTIEEVRTTDGDVSDVVDAESDQAVKDMIAENSGADTDDEGLSLDIDPGGESEAGDARTGPDTPDAEGDDGPAIELDLGENEPESEVADEEPDRGDDPSIDLDVGDDAPDADGGSDVEVPDLSPDDDVGGPPDAGAAAGDESTAPDLDADAGTGESVTASAEGDSPVADESATTSTGAGAAAFPADVDGSLGSALAEELRNDAIPEDDRQLLQEELELEIPSSTKARINHLQSRVEDMAAYTDALEEFLDEEGTAQELMREYKANLEAMEEDIHTLRDLADANTDDVGSLRADVGDMRETVDSVTDRLDAVAEDVTDHDEALTDLEEALEDVDSRVGEVDGRVDDVESDVDTVESELETATDDIEGVDERVDGVETDIDEVRSDVEANRDGLDTVEERVATVEDDVDEVRTRADETADELDAVQSTVEAVTDDVEIVRADLEDAVADVEETDERVDGLEGDLDGVRADLEDTEEELSDVRTDLEETESDVHGLKSDLGQVKSTVQNVEEDLESVEDDVEEIGADVEEIKQWRSELGEMFN